MGEELSRFIHVFHMNKNDSLLKTSVIQ